MDVAGMVFICVMFIISIAVLSFCCLKSCSSEKKYIRDLTNNNKSEIMPTSSNGTVQRKQSVYPSRKPSALGVDIDKKWQNDLYPKTGVNFGSLSKQGSFIDKNDSSSPKPDCVVNETKYTPPKPPFAVVGTRSSARYVVDRGPNVPTKRALVGNKIQSPNLDYAVDGSQSTPPEAGFAVVDRTDCTTPNETHTEDKRKLVVDIKVPSKLGLLLDKSPSITSKQNIVIDETQCASPKQELVENKTAAPNPGFIAVEISEHALSKQEPLLVENCTEHKLESVVNGLQSAIYTTLISPCESKQSTIEFHSTPEAITTNTIILRYTARRRTPSPNPEIYKTSYSPRTSTYFAENAGPFSGIGLSSENFSHHSKPRPPSYEEAMLEYQFPTFTNSGDAQLTDYKLNS